MLAPALPPQVRALYDQDVLVVGEVGEPHPSVRTAYPTAGYSVEFTTGMFLYVDLIMRACAGSFVDGATGDAALNLDAVKMLVHESATTYLRQSRTLWSIFLPKFHRTEVPISDAAANFRDQLVRCINPFMLAHELGHVAMAASILPHTSQSEELDADAIGLAFFLKAASEPLGLRMAIAGAGITIRLFVTLQRLGLVLTKAYGSQEERLATLEAALLAMLGSQQIADESSTVMVALLDLMDDLDARMLSEKPEPHYTLAHIRVGLIARLLEVAKGNLGSEGFIAMLEPYAKGASEDDLRTALNALCDYYWQWGDFRKVYYAEQALIKISSLSQGLLVRMSDALKAIVAALPPSYRTLIDR